MSGETLESKSPTSTDLVPVENRRARKAPLKELDYRSDEGVEVQLLWQKAGNVISLCVTDTRIGNAFNVEVPPESALDAFYHPFAYAAAQGVWYEVPSRSEAA